MAAGIPGRRKFLAQRARRGDKSILESRIAYTNRLDGHAAKSFFDGLATPIDIAHHHIETVAEALHIGDLLRRNSAGGELLFRLPQLLRADLHAVHAQPAPPFRGRFTY